MVVWSISVTRCDGWKSHAVEIHFETEFFDFWMISVITWRFNNLVGHNFDIDGIVSPDENLFFSIEMIDIWDSGLF
ncbi:hypothetical protein D5R40_35160 [Okeania hirsuta]|uniref:Uncharacterized protein n=1 Tax=Okeania hirsuta TaxID=1458930 RepID=A0A3N6N373_9CYAN|nr:hypothetical protein D5R40_35160 [Okeania hirsuta]